MRIAIITDKYDIKRGTGISRYTTELIKKLKSYVDIDIIGTSPPNAFKSIYDHALRVPAKVLLNRNNYDLFHSMAPVNSFHLPFIKKPTVITYHDLATILYNRGGNFYVRKTVPYFYKLGKYSNVIIANSSQTKKEIIDFLSIPEEKVEVIHLGVNEYFKPLNSVKKTDQFIIGFIGSIDYRKRLDFLLESFSMLLKRKPDLNIKLFIYGTGNVELLLKLKKLANDLNIADKVEFKGFAPESELVNIYNYFDIFVIPSEWEGFGIPILEAQKCGVPVIVRNNVNIPSEVTNACVKAESTSEMAKKIYHLLMNDQFRSEVINAGLNYSKQFTWDKTAERTFEVYEKLINSN